jgi:hypothetical protein
MFEVSRRRRRRRSRKSCCCCYSLCSWERTTLDSAQGGQEVAAADCKTTLLLPIDDDYSALLSTPILSLS